MKYFYLYYTGILYKINFKVITQVGLYINFMKKNFFYFIFCLMIISNQISSLKYDTFSYSPPNSQTVSALFASQDLQNFIIANNSVGLLYYTANQNVFNYNSAITTSNTNLVGANQNMSIIFSYSAAEFLLRIFSKSGSIITLLQSITPSATACTFFSSSNDGSRFIIGYSNILVSYKYNGVSYILDSNNTLPSTPFYQSPKMSPDGKFVFYSQYSATGVFRIFKVNTGMPLSQVFSSSINPSSFTLSWFGSEFFSISNPTLGKYDVIIYVFIGASGNIFFVIYMVFDSNLNTFSIKQTILTNYAALTNDCCQFFRITLNGNYFLLFNRYSNIITLYQKNGSSFVSIYNQSNYNLIASPPDYLAEDGSIFMLKNVMLNQIQFYFVCNVDNCATCSWKNICQICNAGFQLIQNSCVANSESLSSTQKLIISLFVIVAILSVITGYMIYKFMKISQSNSRIAFQQQLSEIKIKDRKILTQSTKKIDESREQINEQSHQTLNQNIGHQAMDSLAINPSFTKIDFDSQNSSPNVVKVKQRKRRANLNINAKQIQENLQQVSIQHSFRPQNNIQKQNK